MANLTAILSALIAANHILDHNSVVDAFGHVSVRNPLNNATFFLSGYLAPALVSARADLIEYHVPNGSAVDPNAGRGYAERFIHSEVLKRFPDMNCVVHAHSESVVPYSLLETGSGGVGFESAYHMAGFLGDEVPVFDIADWYNDSHIHDMLVNDNFLGAGLASTFTTPETNNTNSTSPDHALVLMRGHGYTTTDTTIETAVYRAVYAQSNANIQTEALGLAQAGGVMGGGVKYLSSRERKGAAIFNQNLADKPWPYWVRQTEVNPLYRNELGTPP